MTMKKKIFEVLDEYEKSSNYLGKVIDISIIVLIVLSIIAIVLESFEVINTKYALLFKYFELFTVIIFSIEYVLRIWIADLKYPDLSKSRARMKFVFSTTGLIDLIAIRPAH